MSTAWADWIRSWKQNWLKDLKLWLWLTQVSQWHCMYCKQSNIAYKNHNVLINSSEGQDQEGSKYTEHRHYLQYHLSEHYSWEVSCDYPICANVHLNEEQITGPFHLWQLPLYPAQDPQFWFCKIMQINIMQIDKIICNMKCRSTK